MSRNTLVVVVGPTAVGKTKVAIDLARTFGCEIISADSRQFYKEMNIGTAKPTAKELSMAKHHFVNNLSIHDSYSAGKFETEALNKLNELFQNSDKAIVVGGSGLFINALCFGLDDIPDVTPELRTKLNQEFLDNGIEYIQNKVKSIDPDFYAKVDTNNKHRLLRCLEVFETNGQLLSQIQGQEKKPRPFDVKFIGLDMDRAELYDRINRRVDIMMENGLHQEIQALESHKHLSPLNTVGYQEFYNNESREEAVLLIKRNSRRYAKRQLTWFRKTPGISWFHPSDSVKIQGYLSK